EPRGRAALHRPRLELFDRETREGRARLLSDVVFRREAVAVFDQEPALAVARPYQRVRALELGAAQLDAELAARESLARAALGGGAVVEPGRVVLVRRIDAAVPDDDLARAVLSGRDHAFERGIVERMVLGHHRQALVGRVERRALGHGPGLE